jgi:hypothetical protein
MRRSRARGAATVEWVILAAVAIAAIVTLARFHGRIAATAARGGDCIVALDGTCAGGTGSIAAAARAIPVAAVGASSLGWGEPGFSRGMTPAQRQAHLGATGIADPNANYYSPFWAAGERPNHYTGQPDTGRRNTFSVIHDHNSAFGPAPWLGYFDVVTPLSGYTHDDLVDGAQRTFWDLYDWLF